MKGLSEHDIDKLAELIDSRLLLVTGRESEAAAWRELEDLLGGLKRIEGKMDGILGGE